MYRFWFSGRLLDEEGGGVDEGVGGAPLPHKAADGSSGDSLKKVDCDGSRITFTGRCSRYVDGKWSEAADTSAAAAYTAEITVADPQGIPTARAVKVTSWLAREMRCMEACILRSDSCIREYLESLKIYPEQQP